MRCWEAEHAIPPPQEDDSGSGGVPVFFVRGERTDVPPWFLFKREMGGGGAALVFGRTFCEREREGGGGGRRGRSGRSGRRGIEENYVAAGNARKQIEKGKKEMGLIGSLVDFFRSQARRVGFAQFHFNLFVIAL